VKAMSSIDNLSRLCRKRCSSLFLRDSRTSLPKCNHFRSADQFQITNGPSKSIGSPAP
jgi:hypothetical protein